VSAATPDLAGKTIAYTGDTTWTAALIDAAHLRHADLVAHRGQLTARRTSTHMSADMPDHQHEISFEPAHDQLAINL
jgi:ribonuclease BN (tRNA processing enzyme)